MRHHNFLIRITHCLLRLHRIVPHFLSAVNHIHTYYITWTDGQKSTNQKWRTVTLQVQVKEMRKTKKLLQLQ